MTVEYSARALAGLRGIEAYLGSRSPKGMASVIRRIETAIKLVARHPAVGRQLLDRPSVRAPPIGRYPYVVYYCIADRDIMILHIRHSSRRLPRSEDLT